jgi:PhzF family phenazine biosynthesis protein
MPQSIIQIDAFTDRPFAGNPAAVCILPAPADPAWMQAVAREMNLSETAFLDRRADGDYNLRWFTPAAEIDLCGHATLASAHALWEDGHLAPTAQARFHTRSGLLTADKRGDWIELNFPARPPEPAPAPDGLDAALGVPLGWVGKYPAPDDLDYLVEIGSEEAVRTLAPDFGRLAALPVRGLIVTARATTAPYDFVSRFFIPSMGINEDPVTGAAHCRLTPYWRDRLGKDSLLAYQASARGGVLRVRVEGDRVILGGQAVTVLRGELLSGQ